MCGWQCLDFSPGSMLNIFFLMPVTYNVELLGRSNNTSVPLQIRILSCLQITFHYFPSQECMGSDPWPNNVILVQGLGLLEIKWPGHEAYCKNTCAYSIASHVCSGRLLPRLSATKRIPPLSSHVSHKFAFTPKAKQ